MKALVDCLSFEISPSAPGNASLILWMCWIDGDQKKASLTPETGPWWGGGGSFLDLSISGQFGLGPHPFSSPKATWTCKQRSPFSLGKPQASPCSEHYCSQWRFCLFSCMPLFISLNDFCLHGSFSGFASRSGFEIGKSIQPSRKPIKQPSGFPS